MVTEEMYNTHKCKCATNKIVTDVKLSELQAAPPPPEKKLNGIYPPSSNHRVITKLFTRPKTTKAQNEASAQYNIQVDLSQTC